MFWESEVGRNLKQQVTSCTRSIEKGEERTSVFSCPFLCSLGPKPWEWGHLLLGLNLPTPINVIMSILCRHDHRPSQSKQFLTEPPAWVIPDCAHWTVNTNHHDYGVVRYLQVVGLCQEPEGQPFFSPTEGQRVNIFMTVHFCYWGRRITVDNIQMSGQFCFSKIPETSICPEPASYLDF